MLTERTEPLSMDSFVCKPLIGEGGAIEWRPFVILNADGSTRVNCPAPALDNGLCTERLKAGMAAEASKCIALFYPRNPAARLPFLEAGQYVTISNPGMARIRDQNGKEYSVRPLESVVASRVVSTRFESGGETTVNLVSPTGVTFEVKMKSGNEVCVFKPVASR